MNKNKLPFIGCICYSVFLIFVTTFVLLDTYVITKNLSDTFTDAEMDFFTRTFETPNTEIQDEEIIELSKSHYISRDIRIKIDTKEITIENSEHEYITTRYYVADIELTSVNFLKAAFANNEFGKNICDTTSNMAKENNALFAINGDYYGFRSKGLVLRNGNIYRDTKNDFDNMVIYSDGTMDLIESEEANIAELEENDAWQVFSFGPILLNNSNIKVGKEEEVTGRHRSKNPRTGIGYIEPLHYVIIVADGRIDNSGLSLYEFANLFKDLGCTKAYNMDGGGSSTMYFNGEIVNRPCNDGEKIEEREVSDIVYIGY